jgi:hypothetical protein
MMELRIITGQSDCPSSVTCYLNEEINKEPLKVSPALCCDVELAAGPWLAELLIKEGTDLFHENDSSEHEPNYRDCPVKPKLLALERGIVLNLD